ncbi:MAG: hypothetical protein DRG63_12880 [Deltaproteobacteria bacterium]|nr:MAG: hypothetical protein DRG63_12880 [Deltaproteobacteria bacterium]
MMAYLDQFLNFLSTLPACLIYIFLGISAFVENIFPPIPGDTITAFGAFLVGTHKVGFIGVYVSTTIGSLTGFMCLFWIGYRLGRPFFIERDYRFFKAEDILRAEQWFRKYGYFLILLNRFLPGIRSVISISGGISGLKWGRVALLALISCAAWNLIWIEVGYAIGSNWAVVRNTMSQVMSKYNMVVLAATAVVVLFLLTRRYLRRGGNKDQG